MVPVTAVYVAQIGNAKYETLQEAIDAVVNGDTITLLTDCAENVTITQKYGVSLVLDGNGKTYTGKITVKGLNDDNIVETLTIKNFNFETSTDNHIFVDATSGKVQNLTVEDCVFTNLGGSTVNAVKVTKSGNLTVRGCEAYDTYYLVYNTSGGRNLLIEDCYAETFYGARIHNNIGAIVRNSTFKTDVHALVLDSGNSY